MVDSIQFLDFCGSLGNGFEAEALVESLVYRLLEAHETNSAEVKLQSLDNILPLDSEGRPTAHYWVCLMWLEGMGLIERRDGIGGLADSYMTEEGVEVLQAMRERKASAS